MSAIRILVVDDFEPFRRFVSSTLQKEPRLQIVCEVSDGPEAIQKAESLQPDLILLDIGLPTLNGIEAARRIRKLASASKILFVSADSTADLVREAFRSGASGYVVKAHAGSELLAAVEAVLQGKQFVSRGVADHVFTELNAVQVADDLLQKENYGSPAPSLPQKAKAARCHEVHFYCNEASFLDRFTRFIETVLKARNAVIIVATELHRDILLQRLQLRGVDVYAAIEQGSYIQLDVTDTLSTFMVNDMPDPVLFSSVVSGLLEAAAKAAKGEPPRVAACGECAPRLWAQGKAEAAIRLEQLWDEIARTYEADILCGYPLSGFHREENSRVFQNICAEHSAVYG